MEPKDQDQSISQKTNLDRRLDCLRTAILEDWDELEAIEENGNLIIRVKEPIKQDRLAEAPAYKQVEKQRKPSAQPRRESIGY